MKKLMIAKNSVVKIQYVMNHESRPIKSSPVIWSSFMVHMCKRIISSGIFFIYSKFWFLGSLGGKMAKNGPKGQKVLCLTFLSGIVHHMIVIFGTHE